MAAVETSCTEAENARVTVRYKCAALTAWPTPPAGAEAEAQTSTMASTVLKEVSVRPSNLAIVMKAEVGGIVVCYGTSGTPLGESAAARESRAHTTTESRRHLTDLFDGMGERTIEQSHVAPTEKREQASVEPADEPTSEQTTIQGGEAAVPAAKPQGGAMPSEQQGLQVASMLQQSGVAALLAVEDVLVAMERDPVSVSYVVRAFAWSKLDTR